MNVGVSGWKVCGVLWGLKVEGKREGVGLAMLKGVVLVVVKVLVVEKVLVVVEEAAVNERDDVARRSQEK